MLQSQDLGLVLVALIGLIGTLFGAKRGREALTKSSERPDVGGMVEIAGAIISDKKATEIVAALEKLSACAAAHTTALDDNTRACNGMGRKIDVVAEATRDLAKEYKIAGRLGHTRYRFAARR